MVGSGDQGISPQTLECFLGIPYALSTALDNRWRPAVPVGSGTGEFDAGRLGKRCPAGEPDLTEMGEDCLNLNIFRPASRPKDRLLPVLVHVHGGSFNFGSGHNRRIDNMVAWSDRPFLIGISFNYRLAAFGFLSGKLMKDEGALNLGLKDQSLLLQWVQENISAFGGDPDDVTIMGSSAGAHSVSYLYRTPLILLIVSLYYNKSTFLPLLFTSQ
jgi:acetylcholinesterase